MSGGLIVRTYACARDMPGCNTNFCPSPVASLRPRRRCGVAEGPRAHLASFSAPAKEPIAMYGARNEPSDKFRALPLSPPAPLSLPVSRKRDDLKENICGRDSSILPSLGGDILRSAGEHVYVSCDLTRCFAEIFVILYFFFIHLCVC